jgi:predicted nucleic acid-binding OB-fold protein
VEDFKPENLNKNEVFISAFTKCSRIAIQIHQKEKLEALKNVMLNTIFMKGLDENFET